MSTPLTPQAPLTPDEQRTIARLLSDPFYFPLQFKTWLEWFIENAPGGIAGGGAHGGGAIAIPIGGILFWTTPTLPDNTLWCNGAAVSRTVYNALFQVIGTRFGAGDGSTTFNVPDVEGRTIVGQVQSGGHADVSAIGATEGAAKSVRRPKHKHAGVTDSHGHGMTGHRTAYGGDSSSIIGVPGYNIAGINDFSVLAGTAGNPNTIQTRTADVGTDAAAPGVNVGPQTGAEPIDSPAYIVLPAIIRYV